MAIHVFTETRIILVYVFGTEIIFRRQKLVHYDDVRHTEQ